MLLLKTTKISLDDNALALVQYTELIESDKIIMVVLGSSESIKEGVKLVDELSETSSTDENRWVMWVKNHDVLKEQLEPILIEDRIIEADTSFEEIKAFCMKRSGHKVHSRIHKNGEMNFVRLESPFVVAGEASVV